jgi:hypothetical protein
MEVTGECPPLQLRSGLVIADPLHDALQFIETDGTYQSYDVVTVDAADITEADLRIANRMIARMGPTEVAAVLTRRDQVKAALADIPASATLADDEQSVPWDALGRLYATLEGLPGIGLARTTKILHKKRPALVPVLDDVVARYLIAVEGPAVGGVAQRGLTLTRAYHRELHQTLPALACVRAELARRGIWLTECRLLDIYLWAYSGTYQPLWQRQPSLRSGPAPHDPVRTAEPDYVAVPGDIQRFTHDDAGFLAWLGSHPQGYVLNCHHRPRPEYLKLHRADCVHLHRADTTNWTGAYSKFCASNMAILATWAATEIGAQPDPCSFCRP